MTRLTQLFARAATDPARRPEFFRALLQGEIYALGAASPHAHRDHSQAGSFVQVVTWSDGEGPITPFFTSEDTLQRTVNRRGSDRHFVRLSARSFFEMLRGQRLILDPDGDHAKIFTASEVEDLLAGRDPGREQRIAQRNSELLVGAAARIPPDLPRILADFFSKRRVQQAHLGWIVYPETGDEGYLLVVVADDREAAMQGFGMLKISDVAGGKNVDAFVVPPSQKQHWLSDVAPFYVRASGAGSKLREFLGRG